MTAWEECFLELNILPLRLIKRKYGMRMKINRYLNGVWLLDSLIKEMRRVGPYMNAESL